jgi:hypothetical protein
MTVVTERKLWILQHDQIVNLHSKADFFSGWNRYLTQPMNVLCINAKT